MKERLYSALPDLKSVRLFITPLKADINKVNAPEATDLTKPIQCSESSVCDQVNGN
jgi:hypothetical protein